MTVRPIFIRIEPSYPVDRFCLLLYNKRCRRALYIRRAVWLHTSKGGGAVYFLYLTLHIHEYVFSLRVKKDNRHPGW